jgi:hypothetical protein
MNQLIGSFSRFLNMRQCICAEKYFSYETAKDLIIRYLIIYIQVTNFTLSLLTHASIRQWLS